MSDSDARKLILWEAAGVAENLYRDDDNRWNRAIRAYRDAIQKLVNTSRCEDPLTDDERAFARNIIRSQEERIEELEAELARLIRHA